MTDIKLERDYVAVEGTLKILGPDFKLVKEDRKNSSNRARYRRAVVHGHQDQLVINYANDYYGIEINGSKGEGIKMNGNVFVNGTNVLEIINSLQETVGKLIENQDTLAERIKDLEIKAGLRPTRVMESWMKNNKKLLKKVKIRIPTIKLP